jgi:hypothetical protein
MVVCIARTGRSVWGWQCTKQRPISVHGWAVFAHFTLLKPYKFSENDSKLGSTIRYLDPALLTYYKVLK